MIDWVIESDGKGDPSSVFKSLLSHFLLRILSNLVIKAEIVLVGSTLHLIH